MSECINCNKVVPGNVWLPGQVCIHGSIFACSMTCALAWGERADLAPGYRPGEPGWVAEEPARPKETP